MFSSGSQVSKIIYFSYNRELSTPKIHFSISFNITVYSNISVSVGVAWYNNFTKYMANVYGTRF